MRTANGFWIGIALLTLGQPLSAQDDRPPLRWGADKTGGAPYVEEDDDGNLSGFEVELAEYLAGKLGRRSVPVSGHWPNLPELLAKGDSIDIVLNGYEYSPTLHGQYPTTIPYYVYRLQLLVHRDDEAIGSWEDLGEGRPKRVNVLTGSAAQRYMQEQYDDRIELLASDDVATAIEQLAQRQKFDAAVQDNVVVPTYLADYPDLTVVGEPRALGYYVILTRPDEDGRRLRGQLDEAIRDGLRDGSLRRIYLKYGIWNKDQEIYAASHSWPPPDEDESGPGGRAPRAKSANWPLIIEKLLRAAWVTVLLSVISFPLAILLGLGVAVGRMYGPRWLGYPLMIYVEILRGTPLLLQLYFLFYLLPTMLPFSLSPFWTAIVGLAINYSAYEAENYRAGLLAVPRGQMEAALAVGMRYRTALRVVIVPQAIRIVIPPVTNDFIALFKDTSVCSVILVTELTRQYNELYNFNRDLILELAALTAGLYLLMSYPMSLLARRLEHKQKR